MANKTYSDYKRSKKLKSGLFWAVIFGVLLAIIIPIILVTTSLSQIDKQRTKLEEELRQDFNDISLIPHQSTAIEYVDTNDFIEQTSIDLDSENPFSTSQDLKDAYLKTNELYSIPVLQSVIPLLDIAIEIVSSGVINRIIDNINEIIENVNGAIDGAIDNISDLIENIKAWWSGLTSIEQKKYIIAITIYITSHLDQIKDIVSNLLNIINNVINIIYGAYEGATLGIVNIDGVETKILDDINFNVIDSANGSVAINVGDETTPILFPIFQKSGITTADGSFSISVDSVINLISDDGNYWWMHDFGNENTYKINDNEFYNTKDSSYFNKYYLELKTSGINLKFSIKPSINFMYQINLFEHSNHLSNLLIAAGIGDYEVDENGDPIYNMDYSNIFYVVRQWLEYVADKYNTSELNGLYSFIYNETNWQNAWNELFNDGTDYENLFQVLPFMDYTTLTTSFASEYKTNLLDKIKNPDFEMFSEIMSNLNLIFDKRFSDSREAIFNSMIDVVDLQDLPYPY